MIPQLHLRIPHLVPTAALALLVLLGAGPAPVHGAGRTALPTTSGSVIQKRFPSRATARIVPSTPVARALATDATVGGDTTGLVEEAPCGGAFATVFVSGGLVDTTNTGAMRVTCVRRNPDGSGDLLVEGAGLNHATFVDFTTEDNRSLQGTSFVASVDGASLLLRTSTSACLLPPSGVPFVPQVVYIGTADGYFARIGTTWALSCAI